MGEGAGVSAVSAVDSSLKYLFAGNIPSLLRISFLKLCQNLTTTKQTKMQNLHSVWFHTVFMKPEHTHTVLCTVVKVHQHIVTLI